MNPESNATEPWRQPRRSNNRIRCRAVPHLRRQARVALHGVDRRSNAPQLPQGPGTRAAAARANPDTRTRG